MSPNSYSTSLIANAMHPVGSIRLGVNIDSEIDALPDNDARSDDNLGVPDDEDGVTFAGFTQCSYRCLRPVIRHDQRRRSRRREPG